MTEKIVITQEQFDWLERYKSDEEIDYAIDIHFHNGRPDSPVAEWKSSKLARALYNGYEVKPEYKVGEWVVPKDGGFFNTDYLAATVDVVESDPKRVRLNGPTGSFDFWYIRHATPEEIKVEKERRVWAKAGIEVGNFGIDDIGVTIEGVKIFTLKNIENAYENGILKGFYPAESFISFEVDQDD